MPGTSVAERVINLELRRARQLLQDFCAGRAGLQCRCEANMVEVLENGAAARRGATGTARPLLRMVHEGGFWRLYWWRDNGTWEPYPHLPRADSVLSVLDELEQAPLHVHWG